ncbi:hypothetical protein D9M71_497470 [compost metagenome]
MLGVRDFAQGRTALGQDLAHLAGAQTQGHVDAFASNQLSGCTSGTRDLSTLARLQLDTVNGRTNRNVAQRQAVANLDRRMGTGYQLIASTHALRRDDVATLAVCVLQQGNVSSAVRVIFDTLNGGSNAILVATEIDQTIVLLVSTADVASGDAAVVVTTTSLALLLDQRSVRSALVQVGIDHLDHETTASGSRLAFNDCHDALLPYSAPLAKSRSWPGWRAMYAFFQSLRLPRPRTVRLVLPFTLRVVT